MLTWDNAHTQICQVELINTEPGLIPKPADVQAALTEVKTSIDEAQKALEAFKQSVKKNEDKADNEDDDEDSSILATLFNNLGDLQTLTDFAEQIGEAHPKLLTTKTLASLKEIQEIAAISRLTVAALVAMLLRRALRCRSFRYTRKWPNLISRTLIFPKNSLKRMNCSSYASLSITARSLRPSTSYNALQSSVS
jgi:hypothetical protein